MTKRISIIGHFGADKDILDGQTVKTRILYGQLKSSTDWKIKKADTYYKSKNPVKLMLQTLGALLTTKDVIVLLSGNGMKFYFPLLCFASRVFGTRVYHDVIGGNLADYVDRYPKFKKYLNSFKVNLVETQKMKAQLEAQGIGNCKVLPNFKNLQPLSADQICEIAEEPLTFCTFSRVVKEKGVEDAIEAVESINKKHGRVRCKLKIYGAVDEGYKERFSYVMNNCTEAVEYCGAVPYDKSVEAIKNCYALLFPTYWNGEGFPGTVIDAFCAGLPVIASDWNCNAEIVEHKVTGYIYPGKDFSTLEEAVLASIDQKEAFCQMRYNCLDRAEDFTAEKCIKQVISVIENR